MDYKNYLETDYWKEVSKAVKAKAGWKCQVCNSPHDLNAHHRTYEHKGNELEHLDDLVCLCRRCHGIFHGKGESAAPKPKFAVMPRNGRLNAVYDHDADMPEGDPIYLNKENWKKLLTKKNGMTTATIEAFGFKFPFPKRWKKTVKGRLVPREIYRKALEGRAILRNG